MLSVGGGEGDVDEGVDAGRGGIPDVVEEDREDTMSMMRQRLKGYVKTYRVVLAPRR